MRQISRPIYLLATMHTYRHHPVSMTTNEMRIVRAPLICRICGDRARGLNFDVLTCMSCKAFFRRNALKPVVSDRFCFFRTSLDGKVDLRVHFGVRVPTIALLSKRHALNVLPVVCKSVWFMEWRLSWFVLFLIIRWIMKWFRWTINGRYTYLW